MPNLESACSCRIECFALQIIYSDCRKWLRLRLYLVLSATQVHSISCNDSPTPLSHLPMNLGQGSEPEGCRSDASNTAVDCALK